MEHRSDLALAETDAAPAPARSIRPAAPGVVDWTSERYERLEVLGPGDFGEVYVLDWGLAKTLDDPSVAAPIVDVANEGGRLTREPANPYAASVAEAVAKAGQNATEAGTFLGTLGYVAPEQVVDAARVDARADVYALGTILFEILAGEPLHPRASVQHLIGATLSPVDVKARLEAAGAAERVPPEPVSLLSRALAFDRDERPADAGVMADGVQQYLDGNRDLALRRSLAEEHRARAAALVEAASAAEAAGRGGLAERKRALAEVGRALAFDPGDAESVRVLVSLLETPPREVPDEVSRAIDARESDSRAVLAWRGALSWLAALAVVPAMALMGVRSWPAVGVLALLALAGAAHAARSTRRRDAGIPLSAMLSGAVFVAGFSLIFGPLWLGTLAAIACLVPWLTVGSASQRPQAIALASAGVAIPLVLELAGVLPAQYAIVEGALVVRPLLLDFAPAPTFVFLGAVCVLAIVVVAQFAASFRDEVDRSETRLRLLVWQLRQLAPSRDSKAP
jgi:serine/threonine-protein kinase